MSENLNAECIKKRAYRLRIQKIMDKFIFEPEQTEDPPVPGNTFKSIVINSKFLTPYFGINE